MFRVFALLALLALALTGCSRKEPKITGRKSDPPANLQCAWKPGLVYHLRFDLEQLTDPDANESSDTSMYQHRVTFAQECLVKVTNAPGNRLALDLEVKAIEMERAKGPFVGEDPAGLKV